MMRRGLAYDKLPHDFVGCASEVGAEDVRLFIYDASPGYSAVTLNQCMRADKELFLLLAREVVPPFKVDSLGVSPLDSKFQALMYDVRLQQYLLHMQKPTAALVNAVDDCPADPPQGKGKG